MLLGLHGTAPHDLHRGPVNRSAVIGSGPSDHQTPRHQIRDMSGLRARGASGTWADSQVEVVRCYFFSYDVPRNKAELAKHRSFSVGLPSYRGSLTL